MKNLILILVLVTLNSKLIGQVKKNTPLPLRNEIFKILSGQFARCEVTLGYLQGLGSVILGNPSGGRFSTNNDFSFSIYINQRQDMQFGKMNNIQIETNNYSDYVFRIAWQNIKSNQGTTSAEIQILYSNNKKKYETYFINNASSVFKIFWWTELDESQKTQLKKILATIFQNELRVIHIENELKKKIQDSLDFQKKKLLLIEDSLFMLKILKEDSIKNLKRKSKDSLNAKN